MARTEDPTARSRILDAATRLFYERGVHDVGMNAISHEAGTGKNAIYRHFPSKDALVLAYLQGFAERIDGSLESAVAGLPPDEELVALARHVSGLVGHRGYRGCPFRNYLRETRDTREPAGRFALAQVRALRRRVEEATSSLGVEDPDELAARVWVLLEGMYASAPYPERARIAATTVDFIEELVA